MGKMSGSRGSELPSAQVVAEALNKIEELCSASAGQSQTSNVDLERARFVMAEMIFCEVDSRRFTRDKLTETQLLVVMNALCNYFGYTKRCNEVVRNTVFMSLFTPNRPNRMKFLFSLVSMAITRKNIPVLTATGIWMQQLGCSSKLSVDLANYLVKDYFLLEPKALLSWKELPQQAAQFTANFMTTVAEVYKSNSSRVCPPPDPLLEIVTEWISSNPQLCLAAVVVDMKPALPIGAIPMAAVTPFAGLFRWCILAPIHASASSAENVPESSAAVVKQRALLYSQLHLALLTSLLECHIVPTSNSVMSAHQIASITEPIMAFVQATQFMTDTKNEPHGEHVKAANNAVNRFGQAVQVAMSMKCIYGNEGEFLAPMIKLRDSCFIRLVLNAQGVPDRYITLQPVMSFWYCVRSQTPRKNGAARFPCPPYPDVPVYKETDNVPTVIEHLLKC